MNKYQNLLRDTFNFDRNVALVINVVVSFLK